MFTRPFQILFYTCIPKYELLASDWASNCIPKFKLLAKALASARTSFCIHKILLILTRLLLLSHLTFYGIKLRELIDNTEPGAPKRALF